MSADAEFAIHTTALTRTFGDIYAVNNINIRVNRGTMYGFLGRNGAGKSTTIKLLTGILQPSSGEINLLGSKYSVEQRLATSVRRKIGVIPENLALFETLTAKEYLTFVARVYEIPATSVNPRIDEVLTVLELNAQEKQLVLEYSHGMRKKLALAAALLPNPDLLFLDEPFEGVDAVGARVMRDILAQFVNRGSTVFLTSHVLDVVEGLCSHVGIVNDGKLIFEDAMDSLGGKSLEDVFLEKVGSADGMRADLSWLV
ncbi:MAG: ABC transporter ATP-binding protein [Gammaproteobacteria bacterium]|nr:ABC transporter ATP-binding protein [Gammaproteobacteria bacterium]